MGPCLALSTRLKLSDAELFFGGQRQPQVHTSSAEQNVQQDIGVVAQAAGPAQWLVGEAAVPPSPPIQRLAHARYVPEQNLPSGRLDQLLTKGSGLRALFAETENADLNKQLKEIQDMYILPAYLPEKQRKLVFNPLKKSEIEQNPVILEVEGYEHRFSTIDQFTDRPRAKIAFETAVKLMQESGDWKNLATLLAGFRKAGIHLKRSSQGLMLRLAGQGGAVSTLIECTKEVEKTGLRLNSPECGIKLLYFTNHKIVSSGWDEAETKQAQKWLGVLLDQFERREHAPTADDPIRKLHWSKPMRGMMLFNRASVVKVKQDAGEPSDRDMLLLKDEADTLQSLWANDLTKDLTTLTDFSVMNPTLTHEIITSKREKLFTALSGSQYVEVNAQAIRGIELASEFLGEEVAGLLPIRDALEKHLAEFVETSPSPPKGWDKAYENTVGRSPSWAGLSQEAAAKAAEKAA